MLFAGALLLVGTVVSEDVTTHTGKWTANVSSDPIDDSKTVVLMITADSGRNMMGVKPILYIRNSKDGDEVFIAWSAFLGQEASVTWRVDSEDPHTGRWPLSNTGAESFYETDQSVSSPSDVTDFIRSLIDAKKLAVKVTPYNGNPITAVFDLSGLRKAVAPFKASVPWLPLTQAQIVAEGTEAAAQISPTGDTFDSSFFDALFSRSQFKIASENGDDPATVNLFIQAAGAVDLKAKKTLILACLKSAKSLTSDSAKLPAVVLNVNQEDGTQTKEVLAP